MECAFDESSVSKITEFLTNPMHTITRETQDLFLNVIFVKKEYEDILLRGQYDYCKTGNVISYKNNLRNPIHFKVVFNTNCFWGDMVYKIKIYINNFTLDLRESIRAEDDGDVSFENVEMMVTGDHNSYEIISDEDIQL